MTCSLQATCFSDRDLLIDLLKPRLVVCLSREGLTHRPRDLVGYVSAACSWEVMVGALAMAAPCSYCQSLAMVDPQFHPAFDVSVTALRRLGKETTTATVRLCSITLISEPLDAHSLLNVIWPLRRRTLDLSISTLFLVYLLHWELSLISLILKMFPTVFL